MAGRGGRTAPTIADVAARAGVSAMTVSRVVNGEARVRAETREAVRVAIAALDYRPNQAARLLAGSSPIRIGMLYGNPSAAYLSEFLLGGLDHAGDGDVQLVVERCGDAADGADVVRRLVAGGIDGLILAPPLCDARAVLAAVAAADAPAVAVATARTGGAVSTVSIDDFGAACAMTAHLTALGHTRIGFVCGDPALAASARRLDGYRAALAGAGIAGDDALVVAGRFTYRSGLDAAETLLDLAAPPTAIFASNDDMAAAAVAVAHRRGLAVPAALTVCGFDDTALATTIWPELTTVRQPIADMARAAMAMLADEVRARRGGARPAPQARVLDFALVRRASDAPPVSAPPRPPG